MTRLRALPLPRTTAQEAGAWMLLMALIFIPRPFASALQALFTLYSVPVSAEFLGAMMALFGGILILRRRVGRLRFVFLFAPAWLYALCLTWVFLLSSNVGFMGPGFALWCCYRVIRAHARDETRREMEGG